MSGGRVLSVNRAAAHALAVGERTVQSAIGKRAVTGSVAVAALGLEGDEQADPSVHGGLDKAVYAYPSEHYPFWRTVRAQARVAGWDQDLPWGTMGENLSIAGLQETETWVGDLLVFPDCVLAVAGPRQPCYKFNAVMGFNQAAKLMVQSGYCGFYLAVREPGSLAAGQEFTVKPGPRQVGIPELFRAVAAKHR